MIRARSTSSAWLRLSDRLSRLKPKAATASMPGTCPTVQTVSLSWANASPPGSVSTRSAGSRPSRLSSGSPMPWKTTASARLPDKVASATTWPTISAAVRLRSSPMAPVSQKVHARAQPTCVETQSDLRPRPIGSETLSMTRPSSSRSARFRTAPFPVSSRLPSTTSGTLRWTWSRQTSQARGPTPSAAGSKRASRTAMRWTKGATPAPLASPNQRRAAWCSSAAVTPRSGSGLAGELGIRALVQKHS
jgi:hypothetical protein